MRKKALFAAASSALLLGLGGVISPRAAEAATYSCSNTILSILPPTLTVGLDTPPGYLYACTAAIVAGQNNVVAWYRLTGPNPGITVGTQGLVPLAAGFNATLSPVTLTVCVGTDPVNPATWTCVTV